MATAVSTFPLTITTLPTMQQLHNWWQEMHTDLDDLQVAFNDFTPPHPPRVSPARPAARAVPP
jgi:hypothetical protein